MPIELVEDREAGRSVRAKINHLIEFKNSFVTPLDYGAKFDGKTDDTAAIQAAINSGKNVIFPAGTAVISDKITIAGISGRAFEGAGRGLTTIKQLRDNCPIFYLSGSRMSFRNLFLTWHNIQTADHRLSSAFDVEDKSVSGAILATSRFESISISKCAIGFDFSNAIGYSNTLVDFQVSSFAISAVYSDKHSGFTQCRFDSIYIQNQPEAYYRGRAVSGSRDAMQLPINSRRNRDALVGTSIVIEGGAAGGPDVRWITDFDAATNRLRFLPTTSEPLDTTSRFQIASIGTCSDTPFRLEGFTDAFIGMIAFEFLRLPKHCASPLIVTNCATVNIAQCRFERISFSAPHSALITASGRTVVRMQSLQSQFCSALQELGVEDISMGLTYFQAVIRFGTAEADNWNVTARSLWASLSSRSAEDRSEAPWGGVIFEQVLGGDRSFSPNGQRFQYPRPFPSNRYH